MKKSFFLSLLAHTVLIGVLFFIQSKHLSPQRHIRIDLVSKAGNIADTRSERRSETSEIPIPDPKNPVLIPGHHILQTAGDTTSRPLPEMTHQMFQEKKQPLLSLRRQILPESADSHLFSLGLLDTEVGPRSDDIGEQIKTRNMGGQIPFSTLTPVYDKSAREKPRKIRFDFIPNKIQVKIMAVLDQKDKATQMDIYALIADSLAITAEVLNRNLNGLVEKGFLVRKKVSPEMIFSFFGLPIELSRKNRRNPVYQYEQNVNTGKLMTFLQSKVYLLEERLHTHPADSTRLIFQIKELREKILILINME